LLLLLQALLPALVLLLLDSARLPQAVVAVSGRST
jgi:hypothetical protein